MRKGEEWGNRVLNVLKITPAYTGLWRNRHRQRDRHRDSQMVFVCLVLSFPQFEDSSLLSCVHPWLPTALDCVKSVR